LFVATVAARFQGDDEDKVEAEARKEARLDFMTLGIGAFLGIIELHTL